MKWNGKGIPCDEANEIGCKNRDYGTGHIPFLSY